MIYLCKLRVFDMIIIHNNKIIITRDESTMWQLQSCLSYATKYEYILLKIYIDHTNLNIKFKKLPWRIELYLKIYIINLYFNFIVINTQNKVLTKIHNTII